jgi:hypothetical protein
MAAYPADPGGQFASDVHRRVLGHLSTPKEKVGWEPEALLARVDPDHGTPITDVDELVAVLEELKAEGLAVEHKGGVWQQTKAGFDLLTGPIANEPEPGAEPTGPAKIATPTPIGKK